MLNNNKKECSTFELDLTLNNLANMARFKGQQVMCCLANKEGVAGGVKNASQNEEGIPTRCIQ